MNMVYIIGILVLFAVFVLYAVLIIVCCRSVKKITYKILEMTAEEKEQ